RGQLQRVRRSWHRIALYEDIGWDCERARCQLLLAEAYGQQGDAEQARGHLTTASKWILHSGSVEHLCLLHLIQTRLARSARDGEAAQQAVSAGIRLARQCGLGLCLIELLCEQSEVCLARADARPHSISPLPPWNAPSRRIVNSSGGRRKQAPC